MKKKLSSYLKHCIKSLGYVFWWVSSKYLGLLLCLSLVIQGQQHSKKSERKKNFTQVPQKMKQTLILLCWVLRLLINCLLTLVSLWSLLWCMEKYKGRRTTEEKFCDLHISALEFEPRWEKKNGFHANCSSLNNFFFTKLSTIDKAMLCFYTKDQTNT